MQTLPVIYLGGKETSDSPIILNAGDLECLYQGGNIRRLRCGGKEIIRMIYPAVRDRDWGTVPGTISDEQVSRQKDSFSIRYKCLYEQGDIKYQAAIRITGSKDNILTFSMQGEALSSFYKNRIGLNILHPIEECAEMECRVTSPSGEEYAAEFPLLISPHQPMKNIRSMNWSTSEGITSYMELSGEVFEMEDQRNWTDASYKTYCTPLELPVPVMVSRGETLKQEVHLRMETGKYPKKEKAENIIQPDGAAGLFDFPGIGTSRPSEGLELSTRDKFILGNAGLSHYRIDIELYEDNWKEVLRDGALEAAGMELEMELCLFFSESIEQQLRGFLSEISRYPVKTARFIICTRDHLNDDSLSSQVIPMLKERFPDSETGTGTNGNFAELNRNRPGTDLHDFLAWSVNPQVHAFDTLSLIENLSAQGDTCRTAASFTPPKPVVVSPVTLRPRFNVVASSGEEERAGTGVLPFRYDPRQASLFCAGWTLGSIKYLAETGASSITFFEAAGRGGLIHGDQAPATPGLFPARSGDIYPVYFLLRELSKFSDFRVKKCSGPDPLVFSCLMMVKGNDELLAVANHTASLQTVGLPQTYDAAETWSLDEYTIKELRKGNDGWTRMPRAGQLSLNPFAVMLIKTNRK